MVSCHPPPLHQIIIFTTPATYSLSLKKFSLHPHHKSSSSLINTQAALRKKKNKKKNCLYRIFMCCWYLVPACMPYIHEKLFVILMLYAVPRIRCCLTSTFIFYHENMSRINIMKICGKNPTHPAIQPVIRMRCNKFPQQRTFLSNF